MELGRSVTSELGTSFFKGKLHSKVIIRLIFQAIFFLDFDGESLRSKFKQEHGKKKGQKWKISGEDDAAGITSLVSGVKNSRLWKGLQSNQV